MTDPFDDGDDFLTRPLRPDQFDFQNYIAKVSELRDLKKKLCERFLEMEHFRPLLKDESSATLTSTPRTATPLLNFSDMSPILNTDSGTVSDEDDYKDASDLFSDEAMELIIKSPKFKKKLGRLSEDSAPWPSSLVYRSSS